MSGPKVVLVETGEVVALKGVHPVADLFPMLDEDELAGLAASITERGQEHPIVIDNDDQVLDGRNRLAACEIAGVDVRATRYDGDDAAGYALAVNLSRRSLTKGQKAMVTSEALLTINTQGEIAATAGVSQGYVAWAVVVLNHAPDLVIAVKSGDVALKDAYPEARDRKDAKATDKSHRAELREHRPDLANQVDDEQVTVADAMAKMRADEEEVRRRQRVETSMLCEHVVVIAQCLGQEIGGYYTSEMALPGRAVTRKVLADAASAISQMSAVWKERDLP